MPILKESSEEYLILLELHIRNTHRDKEFAEAVSSDAVQDKGDKALSLIISVLGANPLRCIH